LGQGKKYNREVSRNKRGVRGNGKKSGTGNYWLNLVLRICWGWAESGKKEEKEIKGHKLSTVRKGWCTNEGVRKKFEERKEEDFLKKGEVWANLRSKRLSKKQRRWETGKNRRESYWELV